MFYFIFYLLKKNYMFYLVDIVVIKFVKLNDLKILVWEVKFVLLKGKVLICFMYIDMFQIILIFLLFLEEYVCSWKLFKLIEVIM